MPADVTFGHGPDATVTARVADDVPEGAHRLLIQSGFTRDAEDASYTLTGGDAVQRAAQAAFLLRAAELSVDTGPQGQEPGSPVPRIDPEVAGIDVLFARIPGEGIVAATETDSTKGLIPDTLKHFGFRYDGRPNRDVYLQPEGAAHAQALKATAQATLALQTLGFTVGADDLALAPDTMRTLAESVDDLVTERANVAELVDTRDIADVLDVAVDEKVGALPQLGRLLDTVADWCKALPAAQREEVEAELDYLSLAVERVRTDLGHVQHALARMDTVIAVPETAVLDSPRASAARSSSAALHSSGPVLQGSVVAPVGAAGGISPRR